MNFSIGTLLQMFSAGSRLRFQVTTISMQSPILFHHVVEIEGHMWGLWNEKEGSQKIEQEEWRWLWRPYIYHKPMK